MSTTEAILKFDLTDPDSNKDFIKATKAKDYYSTIEKIKELCKALYNSKHYKTDDELSKFADKYFNDKPEQYKQLIIDELSEIVSDISEEISTIIYNSEFSIND